MKCSPDGMSGAPRSWLVSAVTSGVGVGVGSLLEGTASSAVSDAASGSESDPSNASRSPRPRKSILRQSESSILQTSLTSERFHTASTKADLRLMHCRSKWIRLI